METFKINFNSHIRNGWMMIFGSIVCMNIPLIFSYINSNKRNEDYNWIAIVLFIVFIMPGLIIHINYYLINRKNIMKYSHQERQISILHKGVTTSFSLDDISIIKRSISFNQAANRVPVAMWDEYNHSIIHLKNGNIFTITSLLVPNLDLPLEKEKIIIKRNIYRLAKIR